MEDAIQIDNRGDFGLWAIEAAKQIVADQGYELARAARDGSEDEVRVAGNALGQAITNAMMEVFDGPTEGVSDEQMLSEAERLGRGQSVPASAYAALC